MNCLLFCILFLSPEQIIASKMKLRHLLFTIIPPTLRGEYLSTKFSQKIWKTFLSPKRPPQTFFKVFIYFRHNIFEHRLPISDCHIFDIGVFDQIFLNVTILLSIKRHIFGEKNLSSYFCLKRQTHGIGC